MWSQHPEIARKWQSEGKGYVKKKTYTKKDIDHARKMMGGA